MQQAPTKVALLIRWPTGGIRTHVKYLFKHFPPGKYQPVVIAPDSEETQFLLKNLRDFNPIARLVKESAVSGFATATLAAIFQDRVKLLHSHGFTSGVMGGIPAKLGRVPYIVTAHDVVTDGLKQKLGKSGLFVLKTSLRMATVVHAVGNDVAANLAREVGSAAWLENRKMRVIINGVDVPQFSNVTPRALREELQLPAGAFMIGYMGRFMAQKGFRILIDAVHKLDQQLPQDPFVVVAVGGGGFMIEDQEAIAKRGLSHRFRFLPLVENPAPTLAAMDCLTMPSRWEAFSVLAAEAMCLGVPLIASNCIGLREATAGTPAKNFDVGDATQLAAALRSEMSAPSRREALAYAPAAVRRFDVAQSAHQVDELYDELIHRV